MTDPLAELHADIREIRSLLASGQIDTSERLARLETALIPIQPAIADHESRLRGLEGFRYKALGIVSVGVTGLSTLVQFALHKFFRS